MSTYTDQDILLQYRRNRTLGYYKQGIHADEFRESDGVKRGLCAVCGHTWVHYLDRSGTDPEKKLCRKCFSRLVSKETMSFTTLPGVVEVDSLVRVHADLDRCKVCGQGRIKG